MDIRDAVKRSIDINDSDHTMGAGALGEAIEHDLEAIGVIVAAEQVAAAIRRVDGSHSLTSGELADALAEEIEADLDNEEDDD